LVDHRFSPRHRTYGLRDKYRLMRYAAGSRAFQKGNYAGALRLFESALTPPATLGTDDFQFQSAPRLHYYIGRALEALRRTAEAEQAYEKSASGADRLCGDRASWNSENFFMLLSLERLGRTAQAEGLVRHFTEFARTELDAKNLRHRAEAYYLLGLIA